MIVECAKNILNNNRLQNSICTLWLENGKMVTFTVYPYIFWKYLVMQIIHPHQNKV